MSDEAPAPPAVPAGSVLAPYASRIGGLFVDQTVAGLPPFLVLLAMGYTPVEMLQGTVGFWFNVVFVTIGLVHETIGVWRWGRTAGKVAFRTKVVHVADGGSVTLSSAFIRALVPAAFGVVPGIGMFLGLAVYLWAFVDPRRQGIHDKAAGTLVVLYRPRSSPLI